MIPNKNVFLFTEFFPYGKGESFLEHELPVWETSQQKVTIFPLKPSGESRDKRNHIIADTRHIQSLENYSLKKLPFSLVISCLYFLIVDLKQNRKNLVLRLSMLFREAYLGLQLLNEFPALKDGVCYSYWCNHWMLRLSLLKKAGLIKSLVCRVHGFDLYSERHKVGFIPHQAAMLKSADHVFVISQHGKTYLTNKFALKNIKLSKLGVPDHGLGPIPNQLETIQIVSCSNLIAVKQVHLIIDALRQVKRNVVWRHFGGGFLSVELKKLAAKLPENITVIWMGQTSNKNILSFYKNHPVHLFLNVSQSEGLPVSIMEAMSFGIPVAAPSVGGIPEIVNDSNGYDLGIEKIEEILATYIQDMNERLHLKRQNARQMYLRNFSLTNFTHFINQI